MSSPDAPPIHVDPALVLTRVQQSGETGMALVRAASFQVLAEHHAAESADLREQLAALQREAPDESTPAADAPEGETGKRT